jgi:hypothetical protein
MTRNLILTIGLILVGGLSACGTTFQLPELGVTQTQQATQMFAAAQTQGARPTLSTGAAEQRFRRVAGRIKVAGGKYCVALTAEQEGFNCNVNVAIDREMTQRNGRGVAQDIVYTHIWFNIAAANGAENAAKNREIVAKKMSSAQIAEAQRLARECVAKNYKGC